MCTVDFGATFRHDGVLANHRGTPEASYRLHSVVYLYQARRRRYAFSWLSPFIGFHL